MESTRGHRPVTPGEPRLTENVQSFDSTLSRRRFLRGAGAAGALVAAPSSLWAEKRDDDDASSPSSGRGSKPRTLFFNFSHEAESDTASYYLVVGGAQFRLRHAREDPAVLSRARRGNRFLRGVPDSAITHFAQNVTLP